MAGETFGKYVVVRRLAIGGMAEVSLARLDGPAGFNKLVVLKQVLPQFAEDPNFIEMFLDEGRIAARLTHPNIAQTFELGQERGRYFMAMEYVTGRSLATIFEQLGERGEQLPLACTMRITMQLLEALSYAHSLKDQRGMSLKLVHRDVTPSNVMVTFDGSVKLLDFGIAKAAAQSHQTRAGRVKGKAGYMSPEQCRGKELDARSDLYSTGALLYQMATGQRPFEELMNGHDVLAVMQATLKGGFAKPSEVEASLPGAIDDIVLKAMALKADERYANASAMLRELESFSTAMGIYPSTQKLVDLMTRLFPGAVDEVELASPPPLPDKPGPPVPTMPELKPVVSVGFAGLVPRDSATGESGVQTKVNGPADMSDALTNVNPPHQPGRTHDEPEESQTGETTGEIENEPRSNGSGEISGDISGETRPYQEPPSEPEIPTELSGPKKKRKKAQGLPIGWLALAFTGAIAVGLAGVVLFSSGPAPVSDGESPASQKLDMNAPREEPALPSSPQDEGTGTIKFESTPQASVSWGETDFGETPVTLAVPTGEQTFVFRWGSKSRKIILDVKPGETTHAERLE